MKSLIKKYYIIAAILFTGLYLSSCESTTEPDYIKDTFVEGYLIVGEPIEGIMVYHTQPLSTKYNRNNAAIKNANVSITVDGIVYNLEYKDGINPGYAYSDSTVLVQPNKNYYLNITLDNGKTLSGHTLTPGTMEWVREPKEFFHYPQDTVKLPQVDSLDIEWTAVANRFFYFVRIECLDTLNYGKYLPEPTDEMNRRAHNILQKMDDGTYYKNLTGWGFIANTNTPTVWSGFKWFGKHKLAIYCPDANMLSWFVNLFFLGTSLNVEHTNSIIGGYGVFGSASKVEKEAFMYKNQP